MATPVNNGWKQFKDEEPKENQKVWLYNKRYFAPDVDFYTYKGDKLWVSDPLYEKAKPEDYWLPFAYPEPPKVS